RVSTSCRSAPCRKCCASRCRTSATPGRRWWNTASMSEPHAGSEQQVVSELHAGFHVRPMTDADLDAVWAIEQATQLTPWSGLVFSECLVAGYDCEVVERDGVIAAFMIVSRVLDEAHLLNIAVAPAFQRRGLAWALLRHLQDTCTARDTSVIYLEVRASNTPARELYTRFGYQQTGTRKDYYRTEGGREDAILM